MTFQIKIGILLSLFSLSAIASIDESALRYIKNKYSYLEHAKLSIEIMENYKNYTYFCGVAVDQEGDLVASDGKVEVYDMIIRKDENDGWKDVANFNSFSTFENIECRLNSGRLKNFILTPINENQVCKDLTKKDPERMAILNTLRVGVYDKFVVKRLCATSSFAYFCGAAQDADGYLIGTDEALDVQDVILKKDVKHKWQQVKDFGSLASSLKKINCHFDNKGLLENSTLEKAYETFK
ncbi:hypothetical protein GTGU_03153 [Trabulsiella guamensis ATCC 49490]|uniref:Uncharacterized protein n=1 Tax=Trabulsiella guamensis ATCC 49490 TaxID=1005994 RepID=A0A085A2I6_9ENTR|nr:hypothetical protein [Trabulsiella guamensis]KFC04431.1 hypothetical protein GTGU_03153 [Trabulsiella guamensis ATCC 49490]